MTQQLQIISDKLPATLSTTLWVVLTNCKQAGDAYIRYKGEIGCTMKAYALDSKHTYNANLSLLSVLTDCIIISTATQDVQTMYKDVMQLNLLINEDDK